MTEGAADRVDDADWHRLLRLSEVARAVRRGTTERPAFEAEVQRFRLVAAGPLARDVYLPLVEAVACGPLTLAQIGQSLDGRIATESGHSHYVNGPASLDHLHRLRALVDAVVVGAGTVALDDPRLTVRRVAGSDPVRVVIDPRRRLPPTRRLFDGEAPTVVVTAVGAATDGDAIVLPAADGLIAPRRILDALNARGLLAVLVEGGAATVSAFIGARVVDRLHVAVAPLLLGSGRAALVLPPIDRVDEGLRPAVAVHRLGEDVLFDCVLQPPAHDHVASTSR